MATKIKVNWEKIGIYIALMGGFWMIVSQLFEINKEIRILAERTAKLEIKIEKLEEKRT